MMLPKISWISLVKFSYYCFKLYLVFKFLSLMPNSDDLHLPINHNSIIIEELEEKSSLIK